MTVLSGFRRSLPIVAWQAAARANGAVVTELGTKVTAADTVCVDGEAVSLEETKRYVLLNKPAGFVCSQSDEKGRQVAVDLLKSAFRERLYNVGRLDM